MTWEKVLRWASASACPATPTPKRDKKQNAAGPRRRIELATTGAQCSSSFSILKLQVQAAADFRSFVLRQLREIQHGSRRSKLELRGPKLSNSKQLVT
eukprot:7106481-Alexandrium_andersonii.AAC.1